MNFKKNIKMGGKVIERSSKTQGVHGGVKGVEDAQVNGGGGKQLCHRDFGCPQFSSSWPRGKKHEISSSRDKFPAKSSHYSKSTESTCELFM